MARYVVIVTLVVLCAAGAIVLIPDLRGQVRAIVRPEPPAQITPLALTLPGATAARPTATPPRPAATRPATATARPQAAAAPTATHSPTPAPSPTPSPLVVNGQTYAAYIPAASKKKQAYKYSCEFDAAWVILKTYSIDAEVDDMLATMGHDTSVEPYIEETAAGFVIHGGDIDSAFSGDIKNNFLARSTGAAMRKVFTHYGLETAPVSDRAGVEAALRAGRLVWIKTTVDFKHWRPATWVMPDGRTRQTVLGNDHAVVVMGFSERGVVIRDVLGPTSSNWQRPYEYEVSWDTFLAAWAAQEYDGLAVAG